jgi:molybdopterin converting factor small subunit
MEIKIRFLGLLSTKYGSTPFAIEIDPDLESLQKKILELIGNQGTKNFVILKNGRLVSSADSLENGDELHVFMPISGG